MKQTVPLLLFVACCMLLLPATPVAAQNLTCSNCTDRGTRTLSTPYECNCACNPGYLAPTCFFADAQSVTTVVTIVQSSLSFYFPTFAKKFSLGVSATSNHSTIVLGLITPVDNSTMEVMFDIRDDREASNGEQRSTLYYLTAKEAMANKDPWILALNIDSIEQFSRSDAPIFDHNVLFMMGAWPFYVDWLVAFLFVVGILFVMFAGDYLMTKNYVTLENRDGLMRALAEKRDRDAVLRSNGISRDGPTARKVNDAWLVKSLARKESRVFAPAAEDEVPLERKKSVSMHVFLDKFYAKAGLPPLEDDRDQAEVAELGMQLPNQVDPVNEGPPPEELQEEY
jgi:hypothetical protein